MQNSYVGALLEELRAVLDLPQKRQHTKFTCGPVALSMVLAGFGVTTTEKGLARQMKATPKNGVPPAVIAAVAEKHGLNAEVVTGLTIKQLEKHIKARRPVIVAIQSWAKQPVNYATNWEDGHYVVVVGINNQNVQVRDPSTSSLRTLSRESFIRRWHDYSGDEVFVQLGIVFSR